MSSALQTPLAPSTPRRTVALRQPTVDDGGELWRMATESQTLDVNTSYAYLLWCRDFGTTSLMAEIDGEPAGFVIGYVRPENPETLMIWQVAVDSSHRGQGLARTLLDGLVDRVPGVTRMETTITDDNRASIALFTSFAKRRDASIQRDDLFGDHHFPDNHDAERLYTIAPLS
ncbi:diaminobutyrate acetyltransferase [Leekyejoonella antrihumi]|uniref:L-2,4-diaminobutyric acid acetyltransferase n=2 Tax=Leekyejoonella antrihumi TaxID=1660198 RepID=A0A563E000_9MICO|nr:diaminobutyrate acetyltransferase [Leekyejoonella antrihumi]